MYRSTSTSTPSRPKSPAAASTSLPQSTSLPTIPPVVSPPPSTSSSSKIRASTSTDHLRSPQTPASSSKNKNFHPYLIQTTASSLLSRTNSSPVQPIYEGGPRHRVSRSMSSLYKPEGVIYDQGTSSAVESGSDAGREQGTPGRSPISGRKDGNVSVRAGMGMKRSGTLPSFPSMESLKAVSKGKAVEIPIDPKTWTASELAHYLSHTLRKGSAGNTEQSLPGPLIDDITSWILRHQVTGQAFLKGPETWTTSARPPPFLPLLTSVSRRLRRSSLHARISNSNTALNPEDGFGPSSILLEGIEDAQELEDSEAAAHPKQMGVRGMAQAYDAIHSSASDASGDESAGLLRSQNTGEYRREVWKRWEAEMRPRPLKRQDTGSSIGSVDEVALAAARGPNVHVASTMSGPREDTTTDEEEGKGGTIKPSSWSAATSAAKDKEQARISGVPCAANISSASSSGTSPPPPYASGLETSPEKAVETSSKNPSTPLKTTRSASHSVTPTPDPQRYAQSNKTPESQSPVPVSASASTRLAARQSLGRSTSRRLPRELAVDAENGAETDDELEPGHYSAARRATIRPTPRISSKSIFAANAANRADTKSSRELELEKELQGMKDRLKELEERLDSAIPVTSPAEEATIPSSRDPTKGQGSPVGNLLEKLGLAKRDGDGLPNTVRELPVYPFLVGFGVGAVVVRVLFNRR